MAVQTLLRIADVADALGVCPDTVENWLARGDFPRPRRLGPLLRVWTEADINDWIESREPRARSRKNTATAPAAVDALVA